MRYWSREEVAARAQARLWQQVDQSGGPESCWLWTGTRLTANGYGHIRYAGQDLMAHRLTYELTHGPIPKGLEIDHLCRTPLCANPAHLEAVTPEENRRRSDAPASVNARKTVCIRGHNDWSLDKRGKRWCRTCRRALDARRYAARGQQ